MVNKYFYKIKIKKWYMYEEKNENILKELFKAYFKILHRC